MSETALALVQSITAVEFFKPGASNDILEKVEREARALAASFDVSTPAGEAGLRTLAATLGKVKVKIGKEGKALVADEKARLKIIDTERGIVEDRMETLQKEVRQPLTDKENAEKERVDGHESALAELVEAAHTERNWESLPVEAMRDRLREIQTSQREWQEFLARAKQTVVTTIGQIKGAAIARREKLDADAAELEQLRARAAEQAQKDRDEQIAREAREAAESAARERAAEQAREAAAERQRIELERAEAEAKAKQAEAQREQERIAAEEAIQAAHEQARLVAEQAERTRLATEEAARLAEARRVEAEERAAREAEEAAQRHAEAVKLAQERLAQQKAEGEAAAKAAAEKAEREAAIREAEAVAEARAAQDRAVAAERQKIADEQRQAQEEATRRENNRKHAAKINNEAKHAIAATCDLTDEQAQRVVEAIAKGLILHTKISY